jgi:hypothetical protein
MISSFVISTVFASFVSASTSTVLLHSLAFFKEVHFSINTKYLSALIKANSSSVTLTFCAWSLNSNQALLLLVCTSDVVLTTISVNTSDIIMYLEYKI